MAQLCRLWWRRFSQDEEGGRGGLHARHWTPGKVLGVSLRCSFFLRSTTFAYGVAHLLLSGVGELTALRRW
jgi:hypothetical protein